MYCTKLKRGLLFAADKYRCIKVNFRKVPQITTYKFNGSDIFLSKSVYHTPRTKG